jgi:phosphatidylserine decarboxylase
MSSLSFGERVARSAWRVTPQRALSEIIGWGARRSLPGSVRASFLRSFARKYGIDTSEAEKPLEQYSGLAEFFTRRLRPDARPVDQTPGVVVSVADGTVVDRGVVTEGKIIDAKGTSFSLAELLADSALAAALDGGAFEVTYLSPRDYHRVHSPTAGRITAWHYVPGRLFPVNNRSVLREPGLFAINERFVTALDGEAGRCAVVMVAAVGVGHITASYDPDVATHASGFAGDEIRHKLFASPPLVDRGAELGVFNLGSTTIVVFEPGRVTLDPVTPGSSTRMGRPIGRVVGQGRAADGRAQRANPADG